MAGVITDEGKEVVADFVVGNQSDEIVYDVAVGTGGSTPTAGDVSLDSEVYRTNRENSNCSITETEASGQIKLTVTLNGGTEVDADAEISELGVFTEASGTLLYREVTNGVVVEAGETVTFELVVDVVSA